MFFKNNLDSRLSFCTVAAVFGVFAVAHRAAAHDSTATRVGATTLALVAGVLFVVHGRRSAGGVRVGPDQVLDRRCRCRTNTELRSVQAVRLSPNGIAIQTTSGDIVVPAWSVCGWVQCGAEVARMAQVPLVGAGRGAEWARVADALGANASARTRLRPPHAAAWLAWLLLGMKYTVSAEGMRVQVGFLGRNVLYPWPTHYEIAHTSPLWAVVATTAGDYWLPRTGDDFVRLAELLHTVLVEPTTHPRYLLM